MDGNGGPGRPPFRPNHGAIVHFSTSWPPQALKKSAARPLRRVWISTASALRASAVRSKTARSRGRRLFSTLMGIHQQPDDESSIEINSSRKFNFKLGD